MDDTIATPDTIDDVLTRISAAWDAGDAAAFAREFTEDATYVIFVGLVYEGRAAIERGHVPVFEKWQKGSRMRIQVQSVRHLGDDVAVALTEAASARVGGSRSTRCSRSRWCAATAAGSARRSRTRRRIACSSA